MSGVTSWGAFRGCGILVNGVRFGSPGRAEFTTSLCVAYVPIAPLKSWSGIYAGEAFSAAEWCGGPSFVGLNETPHVWGRIGQTYIGGVLTAALAMTPSVVAMSYVIARATRLKPLEMCFLLGSICWAVAFVFLTDHLRTKRLERTRSADAVAGRSRDRLL